MWLPSMSRNVMKLYHRLQIIISNMDRIRIDTNYIGMLVGQYCLKMIYLFALIYLKAVWGLGVFTLR